MELVPIFADPKPSIFAVLFDEEGDETEENVDEFRKAFSLWGDVEYLERFFEENRLDLESGFYGNMTVSEAVEVTLEEAQALEDKLYELAENRQFDGSDNLEAIFRSLDNNDYKTTSLQRSKAYGGRRKSWLRIYAIRIAPNLFVITGGAIKLTLQMGERAHTRKELMKLDRVRYFLKEEGLIDESDFERLELDF
ncbi:hypothetical protein CLV24_11722 [Pontibacter ummariensis]|uniref:Uncharacterized protein n=1 Tax=Pontibacter ummariensis TaxID=1610492 RepID=A0A239IGM6_9BACT|nr:hypothetical protein [Pontibacter ummariensis]PRY09818.1 hypothetical protein CLV24_11722 [Pontibacter ummariensis]SNS92153.1 hypothetical protein SAMN06296052_11722 [Pontibacter ummariensis]